MCYLNIFLQHMKLASQQARLWAILEGWVREPVAVQDAIMRIQLKG